jgi:hypothetical protein
MVIIVIIAGISNWLQRRAQAAEQAAEEQGQQESPPVLAPEEPDQTSDSWRPESARPQPWGDLGRLLQEEPPRVPPVRQFRPEPAPPRPRQTHARIPEPPLAPPSPASQIAASTQDRLRQLREIQAEQQQRIDEIRSATRRASRSQPPARDTNRAPEELGSVFAMTRSPRAARQAFVASLIFSLPKGLEGPHIPDR